MNSHDLGGIINFHVRLFRVPSQLQRPRAGVTLPQSIQSKSHVTKANVIDLPINDKEVLKRLKHIDSNFNENCQAIEDPENFDFLYSLIKYLDNSFRCYGENIETRSIKVLE